MQRQYFHMSFVSCLFKLTELKQLGLKIDTGFLLFYKHGSVSYNAIFPDVE